MPDLVFLPVLFYGCRPSAINSLLEEDKCRQQQITGALLMMQYAFETWAKENDIQKPLQRPEDVPVLYDIFISLFKLLRNDDILACFSAAWCIAWSGYNRSDIIPARLLPDMADKLVALWIGKENPYNLKRAISWALFSICSPSLRVREIDGLPETIETNLGTPQNEFDELAAVHLSILIGRWTKEDFRKWLNKEPLHEGIFPRRESRFLKEMGYFENGQG